MDQKLNEQDIKKIRAGLRAKLEGFTLCKQLSHMVETEPELLHRALENYGEREPLALAGLNAYLSVEGAPVNHEMVNAAMYIGATRGPIEANIYAKIVKRECRSLSFAGY